MKISTLIKLLCIFATAQCLDFPSDNIEHAKIHIIRTLNNTNPRATSSFIAFSQRYEKLVTAFFDQENNLSLQAHILEMEENIDLLSHIIRDPEFISVRPILIKLYPQFVELVATLKSYINSRNYVSLALSVRKYKFLLPDSIKMRGDISILWSLRHRLRC
jgi:hypothetical protein